MSLKKIAQMAGTSVSTVSKVLNDTHSSCASQQLKEKIWAAAHEIGYVPNQNARNLKKGVAEEEKPKKTMIVMARPKIQEKDLFFRELFKQLEIELFKQGVLMGGVVSADDLKTEKQPDFDGIIVIGRSTAGLIEELKSYTSNIVGIWRNPMDFEVDEIICDGRKAAQTAVEHLIGLGHEKIGYIGDCSYESRYVGYNETMMKNRLPIDYDFIVRTDQTKDAGEKAMEFLLEKEELTAVLCANDMTAIGALEALKKQNDEMRRKISVISIDDTKQAKETEPPLTAVHIPRKEMAHEAVSVLKDRMEQGHNQPFRVEFPCRITVRESCYRCSR